MARRWVVWLSLAVALAGCTQPSAAPVPSAGDVAPAVQQAPPEPEPAPPEPPVPKDARLLRPDPLGRYIADVDRQLRVLDYEGQMLTQFELEGAPVQEVLWSPGGDQLLVITGQATLGSLDGVFQEARYWLLPVPQGAPRELTGLPQEVIFSWSADEQSLYVLDNWRRNAPLTELGERIQRYDLATGQLTQL
ncbi:MAG TPA: hypothetical protein VK464_18455, partial [Symbiobacteriaceae bacterium]|nr:hypothetical protein [Symbiobacteriaceae bacterium]